jgi:hypothetical protein
MQGMTDGGNKGPERTGPEPESRAADAPKQGPTEPQAEGLGTLVGSRPAKTDEKDTTHIGRTERAGLQKLEVARTLATGANRVFLVFFLSLVLSWVQLVPPRIKGILHVATLRQTVGALRVGQYRQATTIHELREEKKTLTELESTLNGAQEAERADHFPLPGGFGALDVPPYSSPFLWSLLCLALLIFLDFSRRRCFSLVGRALRLLQEEVNYRERNLVDICPGLPWWLIPLPGLNGKIVTAEQMRKATGWIANRQWLNIAGGAALVGFLSLQLLTIGISFLSFLVIGKRDPRLQFILLELNAAVLLATILCVFDWVRTKNVPDNLAEDKNPNEWGRREALRSLGYTTAGLIFFVPGMNLIQSYRFKSSPRIKRRKTSKSPMVENHSPGGYLNMRSGVVHFVSAEQGARQPGLRGMYGDYWRTFKRVDLVEAVLRPTKIKAAISQYRARMNSENGAKTAITVASVRNARGSAKRKRNRELRLDKHSISWSIEREVERLLAQKPPATSDACALLFQGICIAPCSLRLYDRLAVICVQYNLPDQLKELITRSQQQLTRTQQFLSVGRMAPKEAICMCSGRTIWPPRVANFRTIFASEDREGISLWDRVVTGMPPLTPRKKFLKRPRYVCKAGKKVLRIRRDQYASGTGQFSRELASRIAAWQNLNSSWWKKWSAKERMWKLPQVAKKCVVGKA